MGLNLDHLTGEFGPDWLELTEDNIFRVRDELKMYTYEHVNKLIKSLQKERLHLYDGIIIEISPTIFFVYNSAANRFKFVGVKPDYLRMIMRSVKIHSYPSEIYDSKDNFLKDYKEGNALICLNDPDLPFDGRIFCSKYLILEEKSYVHIQYENFVRYYDHKKRDIEMTTFTFTSFLSIMSLATISLVKDTKLSEFGLLISMNFWIFFVSILMSFIVEDFQEENRPTFKISLFLTLLSFSAVISHYFIPQFSILFALILFIVCVKQELMRRQNHKNLRKSIEMRHSFVMDKLQGKI